jgi:hypothetical protein
MATKRVSVLLVTAALGAAMMLGALAVQAQAALRHIEGTVVSKSTDTHTFKLKTQSGNRIRIKVNSATVFQRIAGGFGGLRAGMAIEVEAKKTASGLLAKHVEPRQGGGGGADDNGGGGGHDTGPNHA